MKVCIKFAGAAMAALMLVGASASLAFAQGNVGPSRDLSQNDMSGTSVTKGWVAQSAQKDPPAPTAKSHHKARAKDPLHLKVGRMHVHLGGRLSIDSALLFNRRTTAHSGAMGSGMGIGQARLRAKVKYGHWNFQVQYEFTSTGEAGIKFAYVQYMGFKHQALTLGNQFEQFGMENSDTTLATTFPSQSVPFAAIGVGPRHLGFAYTTLRGPIFWGVGVYGPVPGYQNSPNSGSQGIDFATRLGFDPITGHGELLHFGISGRYHNYGGGNTSIGTHNDGVLAAHAGLALSGLMPVLIAARSPNSRPNHEVNLNGAFAAEYHALSVQGEYYEASISGLQNLSSSSVTFHGYYAQVQYFLTGESRPFLRSPYYADIWIPTHPLHPINEGGMGAWEIAARYSEANLNDGPIQGGEERDVEIGVNWIPVAHIRVMLDGMRVLPIQGGRNNRASFDAIYLRTQVSW